MDEHHTQSHSFFTISRFILVGYIAPHSRCLPWRLWTAMSPRGLYHYFDKIMLSLEHEACRVWEWRRRWNEGEVQRTNSNLFTISDSIAHKLKSVGIRLDSLYIIQCTMPYCSVYMIITGIQLLHLSVKCFQTWLKTTGGMFQVTAGICFSTCCIGYIGYSIVMQM